jgi:NPCBM/NEW2 domain
MAGTSKETSWHFDPKRIAEGIFVTTIGGILVAWATGVIGLNLSGNNGTAPVAVTTTEPPSNSTPSFVPGSSELNDDGQGSSETTPSFPSELPLATAKPIGLHQDVAIDSTLQIDGQQYIHSLNHRCNSICHEKSGVGSVEFDLGGKYRKFEATVGVSETAEDTSQVGTFVVYVDGVNKGTWQVIFGQHESISVDVSGGIRLKLESSRDGDVGNPAGNGAKSVWGIKPDLPDLVWGTPRVVR